MEKTGSTTVLPTVLRFRVRQDRSSLAKNCSCILPCVMALSTRAEVGGGDGLGESEHSIARCDGENGMSSRDQKLPNLKTDNLEGDAKPKCGGFVHLRPESRVVLERFMQRVNDERAKVRHRICRAKEDEKLA